MNEGFMLGFTVGVISGLALDGLIYKALGLII